MHYRIICMCIHNSSVLCTCAICFWTTLHGYSQLRKQCYNFIPKKIPNTCLFAKHICSLHDGQQLCPYYIERATVVLKSIEIIE